MAMVRCRNRSNGLTHGERWWWWWWICFVSQSSRRKAIQTGTVWGVFWVTPGSGDLRLSHSKWLPVLPPPPHTKKKFVIFQYFCWTFSPSHCCIYSVAQYYESAGHPNLFLYVAQRCLISVQPLGKSQGSISSSSTTASFHTIVNSSFTVTLPFETTQSELPSALFSMPKMNINKIQLY